MLFLQPNAASLAGYFRKLWPGPCMKKLSLFQQQAVAEPPPCSWQTSSCRALSSTAVYSSAECDVSACGQAGACHESAHTALPASLDSFPCRRELDENSIFTNSYFLVEVDEAPGPLNHSFLIKGQPLRQEQHCLKLIFFFNSLPPGPHGKTPSCFISIYMPTAGLCSQIPPGLSALREGSFS